MRSRCMGRQGRQSRKSAKSSAVVSFPRKRESSETCESAKTPYVPSFGLLSDALQGSQEEAAASCRCTSREAFNPQISALAYYLPG